MNFACYKIHEITLYAFMRNFSFVRFFLFFFSKVTDAERVRERDTDAEFCMLQNGVGALNPKKLD